MTIELPKLMRDDSTADGPGEAVMDYVISWCVRWAQKDLSCVKPILHSQCKKLLCKLLDIADDVNVIFNEVRVWKQCEQIDLWIEVSLVYNGNHESHAILVEDKYYSNIHGNQLEKYKNKFDEYYNVNQLDYHRHYVVVTCVEREDPKFNNFYGCVGKYGYRIMDYYEFRGDCVEETESDIYNEFWLNW